MPLANENAGRTYDIVVTSAQKILGVIATSSKLDTTDPILGRLGTTYPTGVGDRGEETGQDTVTFNAANNTVTIHNVTTASVDEIRIVVASVPELSTFIGFGSFVALGGFATFRQRKQARKAA